MMTFTVLEQLAIETAPCGCRFQVVRFGVSPDDSVPSLWGLSWRMLPKCVLEGWGWIQFDNPNVPQKVVMRTGATANDARNNALLSLSLSA